MVIWFLEDNLASIPSLLTSWFYRSNIFLLGQNKVSGKGAAEHLIAEHFLGDRH